MNKIADSYWSKENWPDLLKGLYRTDVMLRLSILQFHLINNNPNINQYQTGDCKNILQRGNAWDHRDEYAALQFHNGQTHKCNGNSAFHRLGLVR